jgi:hypothetical protein
MLVIRLQFLRLYNYFSHKRGGKMKPESGKLTIGRNDSCPGGQSVKFKKCLVAHRELHERSTPAEVGWVCSRWQAAVPPLEERLAAMPSRRTGAMEKLDQVLEEAIKVGRFVFFCPSFHFHSEAWPRLVSIAPWQAPNHFCRSWPPFSRNSGGCKSCFRF